MSVKIVVLVLVATGAAACHLVTRDFTFQGGDGGAGAVGGAGATGGAGGEGAVGGGAGGLGGSGGDGGAGGQPPLALIDDHLIVRYYLDEAATGMAPAEILDHAAPPLLNLETSYTSANMTFVDDALGRGLSWTALASLDRASTLIDSGKVKNRLQGSTSATIEVVMQAVQIDGAGSHIFGINVTTTLPRFGLYSTSNTELSFYWQPAPIKVGQWTIDLQQRNVLHMVLDTTQLLDGDRVRLYRNGQELSNIAPTPAAQGQMIDLSTLGYLVVGNRAPGASNFLGTMYYAALYDDALTQAEITQNAAVLALSDDPPVN